MADEKTGVAIAVLGILAVLAIIGLVLMFSTAMSTGQVTRGNYAGQYPRFGTGAANFEEYCLLQWEGVSHEVVAKVDKPCADFLKDHYRSIGDTPIIGNYPSARYSGILYGGSPYQ